MRALATLLLLLCWLHLAASALPAQALNVTTLAGSGEGHADGPALAARFSRPAGIVCEAQGTIFLCDSGNHCVRRVGPDGAVTTFAGTPGKSGLRDGAAGEALFNHPSGIALAPDGTLYVADSMNHAIRAIDKTGRVSTLAGKVRAGHADGDAAQALFSGPTGLALDAGSLWVADTANHCLRRIDLKTLKVETVAGKPGESGSGDGAGTAARFNRPVGLAFDDKGNVAVADQFNSTLRRVDAQGTVTTLAGKAGTRGHADGAQALLNFPAWLAGDGKGGLWFTEPFSGLVRQWTPEGVHTRAGASGQRGEADGFHDAARFNLPAGLAITAGGDVVLCDGANHRLRRGIPGLPDRATAERASLCIGETVKLSAKPATGETWRWSVVERPKGSTCEVKSGAGHEASLTPDVEGRYTLRLEATRAGVSTASEVAVNATRSASPVIRLARASFTWTEGELSLRLDPGLEVSDADSPTLEGGSLRLEFSRGYTDSDVIGWSAKEGVSADAADLDVLCVEGKRVARMVELRRDGGLRYQLLADATPARVQVLLRAIWFANNSRKPVEGERELRITLTDGRGGEAEPVVLKVTVKGVNDAPVATEDAYETSEDIELKVAADKGLLANDSDPDGPVLEALLVTGGGNGKAYVNKDGSFRYAPNPGFSGEDSFTYKVTDGSLESAAVKVVVKVREVNDGPPVCKDDAHAVLEGEELAVKAPGLLANDKDPDGAAMTLRVTRQPANGTLQAQSDGAFTYRPNAGFSGTDTFTYRASDGELESADATVTITVTARNRAPVAAADKYETAQDKPLTVTAPGVLANDNDADDDPLVAEVVKAPANGTLTLKRNGSFTYTPNAGFSGTDSFTYRVADGSAVSAEATVTINVSKGNTAPEATADSFEAEAGKPLSIAADKGVLANDKDADGEKLTAVLVKEPAGGKLTLNADGGFTYTPNEGFTGEDEFEYKASDGKGESAVVKVKITVKAIEDDSR